MKLIKQKYLKDKTGVLTVGYEGLSIDEFLMKLIREKIHILIDVRKNPWSMKFGYKKHEYVDCQVQRTK